MGTSVPDDSIHNHTSVAPLLRVSGWVTLHPCTQMYGRHHAHRCVWLSASIDMTYVREDWSNPPLATDSSVASPSSNIHIFIFGSSSPFMIYIYTIYKHDGFIYSLAITFSLCSSVLTLANDGRRQQEIGALEESDRMRKWKWKRIYKERKQSENYVGLYDYRPTYKNKDVNSEVDALLSMNYESRNMKSKQVERDISAAFMRNWRAP